MARASVGEVALKSVVLEGKEEEQDKCNGGGMQVVVLERVGEGRGKESVGEVAMKSVVLEGRVKRRWKSRIGVVEVVMLVLVL